MAWNFLTGLFDGNRSKGVTFYDDKLPSPPSCGGLVPPPEPPKTLKNKSYDKSFDAANFEFKGFTPPPKSDSDTNYDSKDYSDFLLTDKSRSLYNRPSEIVDRLFKSPRAKNCYESIKLGWKMGGAVGGIFGTLTGVYAALKHRSLVIIPISTIGGAVSFGFFLGCGMIVRC
ncbi:hypothetical protein TpMuguga_04g00826 [Theileria parva strain Muguga]|uniref:Reactive oxygen species modulator 1 n=1 Tax=Theileria parva TaxID=5875 RepID=Q4N1C0_THEPA|nr:uncharacterized protein TpMuguga_04g00826 [Theileria parva strain Muguga]EAN32180.1 hypothetical protein TpMuguga_04g00826 [Theileria parva strain Muguga]|eukprot:XP_764463.1 hypothetical protein [Theileria parva strain Muguga]